MLNPASPKKPFHDSLQRLKTNEVGSFQKNLLNTLPKQNTQETVFKWKHKRESKQNVNLRQGSVEKGEKEFLVKKNERKPKLTTMMGGMSAFGHPCSKFIFDTNLIS